ncbi:MAG: hypothetical protein OEW19_05840 [Acidobacteriota bacterium]|nr:hypothetical protein [Acidobacteriota bacterium]
MRATYLSIMVAGFMVVVGRPVASGQTARNLGPVPRTEAVALNELVDAVLGGAPPGGDAWLKWNSHFMRAADGRVYVPFTLTLNDVDEGFESIAMYVRVVPHGATSRSAPNRVSGSDMATPVSAPERQFSRGNPTAGEASARLGLMASEFGSARPPFEGYFVARTPTRGTVPMVRRSLVVAPGDYDVYLAVRERPGTKGAPKSAVVRQTLSVPDLGGDAPTMSSVILADHIDALAKRPSPSQREERPYAFGSVEVFPDFDATFAQDDVLSVVFFVYNLAVDDGKLPDVTVEYRFHQMSTFGKLFGELPPQRLSRAHETPAFDLKAGHQLAVTQALPLATFPADTYELEIVVSDHISGRVIQRVARFRVI